MSLKRRLQKWLGITAIAERLAEVEMGVEPVLPIPMIQDEEGNLYPLNSDKGREVEASYESIKKGYDGS